MLNEVVLVGQLANKPVVGETQQGIKIATMVLQVYRPYRNNLGIQETDYINCTLWKGIASQVADCCKIGSVLGVKGRLISRSVELSNGEAVLLMEVKVENVVFFDKYLTKK